jgi:hypothetical protein
VRVLEEAFEVLLDDTVEDGLLGAALVVLVRRRAPAASPRDDFPPHGPCEKKGVSRREAPNQTVRWSEE